jgi:hypothetical protein
MAGSTRVSGLARAVSWSGAGRWALLFGACSIAGCLTLGQATAPEPGPVGASFGGGVSIGGESFGGTEASCTSPISDTPTFTAQVIDGNALFAREFYSWTTDEQAAQLRKDQILFSQPAGSAAPFTFLNSTGDPIAHALSSAFQMGRYAWPEPWPTRMGWPGQDPGGQLLRIVLKPEAWLAVASEATLVVYDAQARPVAEADVLAHPELVGVIYFDTFSSSVCGSSTGYREFLLGNLGMVQEWSLGTQQIADRVTANVVQLTQFLNIIRRCPNTGDPSNWAMSAVCSWGSPQEEISSIAIGAGGVGAAGAGAGGAGFGGGGFNSGGGNIGLQPGGFVSANGSEEVTYDQALAIPSANYMAAPAQIATIIETLQGDSFKLDPLVVTPGSP